MAAVLDSVGTLRSIDLDTGAAEELATEVSAEYWDWGPGGAVASLVDTQLTWIAADGQRTLVAPAVDCGHPPVALGGGVAFLHQEDEGCGLYYSTP